MGNCSRVRFASEYYDHSIELLSIFKAESNQKVSQQTEKVFRGETKKKLFGIFEYFFQFGSLGQVSALTLTYCAPAAVLHSTYSPSASHPSPPLSAVTVRSCPPLVMPSVRSFVCGALCEICTLFAQHATQMSLSPLAPSCLSLPPLPPLLLCLPACLPAPVTHSIFHLYAALGMPAGQRHKRFPLYHSTSPPPFFSCSSYPAGVYLLICVWLHCSLSRSHALRLFAQVFTSDLPCCLVL